MTLPFLRRSALTWAAAALVAATSAGSPACGQEVVAAPTRASGVYAVGEPIEWRVEVKGGPGVDKLAYVVKKNGLTPIKDGTVDLAAGVGMVQASLDEPGALLVEFKLPAGAKVPAGAKANSGAKPAAGDKAARGLAGAVVAPEKIQPTATPPADFDAFWKAKLDELAAVPANPKLEPADADEPADAKKAADEKKPDVEYFKLTLDNVRGTRVYGQLAKPKKPGKYPALLLVQYAGVYGLPKSNVTSKARQGWLTLNIMAHDLPFDKPKAFYDEQAAGPLKDYVSIGSDDKEKSYFLRMCLGCYRAAEYLTTRDDWDGRTLVVSGTSQGGYQAFVTAGLHPRVTAMLANVPAGCDAGGRDESGKPSGRAAGWPYWAAGAKGRDVAKVVETSRYFDAVNFARRVKVPALVSMGLIDETCPAAAVLGACNVVQGKVERVILPKSNHHGTGNAQAMMYARTDAWLRALAKGEEPPEKK
jgi:cephalosporin-C deacetylase